jgi:hypothetical protein
MSTALRLHSDNLTEEMIGVPNSGFETEIPAALAPEVAPIDGDEPSRSM